MMIKRNSKTYLATINRCKKTMKPKLKFMSQMMVALQYVRHTIENIMKTSMEKL